jgi:hypothetical protein
MDFFMGFFLRKVMPKTPKPEAFYATSISSQQKQITGFTKIKEGK